jgi:EAL and modified HD-GYP domain-containing signal transduction protein
VQIFIARQPIFDTQQKVYGYELLFRSGPENYFDHPDLDHASSKVISDSNLVLGMRHLTGGKRAFFNVTREVLIKQYTSLIPRDLAVVEILENVKPDPEVIDACQKLKQAGYLIALDDFVYQHLDNPLVKLADIIKVDFLETDRLAQQMIVERLSAQGVVFLAEKVETWSAFQAALEMGYTLFQGYFFSRPKVLSHKDIPGHKINYLRILQEINRPDIDLTQIEAIVKRDMSLTYKLLRYLNSAAFSCRQDIKSIRQALMLLGEKEIKKWATLIALVSMAGDKPEELVAQALVRAQFCQSLASGAGLAQRAEDLFLVGLFSLIDAILDRELADILSDVPVSDDIKEALLGRPNLLHEVYESTLAYEQGDWERLKNLATHLGIDEAELPVRYLGAVEWSRAVLDRTAA